MASSLTSSTQKRFKYDVFLSFSGEDVRKNFVDHLYFALQQKGVYTYKDDERIKKGRKISDELIQAIEDSKFYIILFSKNYASSSWCLDELVKIMECHNAAEHTAYPVFYDVEPTEVRKQSGDVGEAFSKHEKEDDAGKWREALTEAAGMAGWELKKTDNGQEAKLIQKIVAEISLELRSINSTTVGKLVGMEARVRNVVSYLETCLDGVLMIGIKGMGGGGKTTLARAVFEQISFKFEGCSFVENVREVSKYSLYGLKLLQMQVLSDVLNDKDITVSTVYDGKNKMKKMMSGRKVLVVLDDVDHLDQLEALAGECNWFKNGSRIIITTRDEQVLIAHRVNLIQDVSLLSEMEALCLFSRYAFGGESPLQGYEGLSRQVVRYAAGLPLTIRVLGSFLCGRDDLEWKDAIKRLKTIPLKDTMDKLGLSYIGLEEDYKEIFLDVACILKGEQKDTAIQVLESCGFHARNGLRVLELKSLLTISKYGSLDMHDHIEEMGRNIVRQLHTNEPSRHSRLWIGKDIEHILDSDLGYNETIRCIKLSRASRLNLETIMRGLDNMKKLRVLYMDSGSNSNDCKVTQRFPSSLRYLSWQSYPFWSLHETFQADNLVGLDMSSSSIGQLWKEEEGKVLDKLRYLDLSRTSLRKLNLSLIPNIEILNLKNCSNLTEVHIPYGCLKLKSISLDYSKLRNLNLGQDQDLEMLSLLGCSQLEELLMPFGFPKLNSLFLDKTYLKSFDLGTTPYLKTLSLRGCVNLVNLHTPITFPNLIYLNLSHSKLRSLNLGMTPNLETLDLRGCSQLVKINAPVGCLKKISLLDLSGCGRFKSFRFEKQFHSLDAGSLSELHLIANSLYRRPFTCYYKEDPADSSLIGNLEKLISMGLCACTDIENISRNISSLQSLRKLTLEGTIPDELLKDLDQLKCLEELILSNLETKHLPDSICMLKQLKSFKIISCWGLEKLPEDFGRLESLEELVLFSTKIKHLHEDLAQLQRLEKLILNKCWSLHDIPESICELKRLKYIHLHVCLYVENLPEELGLLKCLKDLDIRGTSISHLPRSILRLRGLRLVGERWQLESFGFTSKIQTSDDETFCYIY
ncbi:TMV resistance protein N-like protein [Tanacetum coccineum]